MNKEIIKDFTSQYIDSIKDEIFEVSDYIYLNPETAFKEFKSSSFAVKWLEDHNFSVKRGTGKLSTAFKAYGKSKGEFNVAFLAEYDALPIGHACGHNLIAASSLGAAIALNRVINEFNLPGNPVVLGTPAEEGGAGGKILMLDEGFFDDINCAMMIHPADRTMVEDFSLALQAVTIKYFGKSAHCAASPWLGANALEAALQTINLVNAWRCQLKDYTRIHSVVTKGGEAPNVIPEYAEVIFNIRSDSIEYLHELIKIVKRCAENAADAMGVKATFDFGMMYYPIKNNVVLERLMSENFKQLGETVVARIKTHGIGSTDMGNVTYRVPAIHGHLKLSEQINTHTIEFCQVCNSELSKKYLLAGAKAMAFTAIDILIDDQLIEEFSR